ncbi:MAG: glycosyl transferase, partial [Alphaproteobacteria bacterium]
MKVIIVSQSDIRGGAFRAAHRLHIGLRRIVVDSKMLVDNKISDDPSVYGPESKFDILYSKARSFIDRIPLRYYNRHKTVFSPAWIGKNLAEHECLKNADIINLHWITNGFISIKGIAKLAKFNKPIVWTLHDMWAFTGGCHYAGSCEKYKTKCGACPQLLSNKDRDLSRKIFGKKLKYFSNMNLNIVAPCNWMRDRVKESFLLSDVPLYVIPYGLDTDVFKPVEKTVARSILNLPLDKKI